MMRAFLSSVLVCSVGSVSAASPPAQIEQYRRLRGYHTAGEHEMHHQ